MHRIIPSRFSEHGTVLDEISDDNEMLEQLVLLDGATNDRIQGEQGGLGGISTYELVYGIPNDYIIRAAFLHTSETGGRFNDGTRGAWYAGDEVETSLEEVTFHKAKRLADIVVPNKRDKVPDLEVSTYDDWLADFQGDFHALQPAESFSDCLQEEPIPQCYAVPQALARMLLRTERSNGIVYPSVRRKGSLCIVCFRPALVFRPRKASRYEIKFTWQADRYQHVISEIAV